MFCFELLYVNWAIIIPLGALPLGCTGFGRLLLTGSIAVSVLFSLITRLRFGSEGDISIALSGFRTEVSFWRVFTRERFGSYCGITVFVSNLGVLLG